MKQLKFHGEVRENERGHAVFKPDDVKGFLTHTKGLLGEKVTLTMNKYKAYKQRSGEENRYYHGVVVKMLSDELGYTTNEIHEILKYHFLKKEIISTKGSKTCIIGSTATLSTTEMEDYLSKIRAWASQQLSIYIPLPNEVDYEY